jgi:hypothetical protein
METQPDYQTPSRMALKLRAIPLPEFKGKRVLDCGTDFAAWAFLAAERGAADVLGLDRNRSIRGGGAIDLIEMNRRQANSRGHRQCRFERINLGREWREFGKFEVIFLLSVYHHFYECAGGDHAPIWFWLSRHCAPGAQLLWEGPIDDSDPVVRANVSAQNRHGYSRDAILTAACRWFEAEFIGPALHEPTREVWRFTRNNIEYGFESRARAVAGAGGATPAFLYADGRRIAEIETALGSRPVPGSLNLETENPFTWDQNYYRAQLLDVTERGRGLDVNWAARWARFYPVKMEGQAAWALRFEGETYRANFVELIADHRLRDHLVTEQCLLTR